MFNFKAFFKKKRLEIGLKMQSGFIWISVIVGLAFTLLTVWAIIYFIQQAFSDGFL